MIYTVTLNPSIDYYMDFDTIKIGSLNRSREESYVFGGKGINVSRMLKALGQESCAITAVGGFTGQALIDGIRKEGINVKPVYVKGNTRINVKLGKTKTELNGAGAECNENTVRRIKAMLDGADEGDIVVLSGSACRGFDTDIYADIVYELNRRDVLTVVDADGELLAEATERCPFLIKPNHIELGRLFDTEIEDIHRAALYAHRLADKGVKNVLVSMGDNGAVLVNSTGEYYCPSPRVEAVNTVGAGDCMLGGFLYGYSKGMNLRVCTRFAVACGSARVKTGKFPSAVSVNEIFDKL